MQTGIHYYGIGFRSSAVHTYDRILGTQAAGASHVGSSSVGGHK
jgi:hypothetical protein